MRINEGGIWPLAVAFLMSVITNALADSSTEPATAEQGKVPNGQQMLGLPVHVVDADGKPVAKAKVSSWALQLARTWLMAQDDTWAGIGPQDVFTDDSGMAVILYPRFRILEEQVLTTAVSLNVNHPDFAMIDSLHIDVPLETKGPYEIKLTTGVPLEIRPLIDDKPADLKDLFVLWSDGRSWHNSDYPEKKPDGILRLPAMAPGKNSVLLVKLDGDRATHFSKITEFDLKAGETKRIDIALHRSLKVEGSLSSNVPRPIHNGRIKTETLAPARSDNNHVSWFSWAPIQPDGTFVIDGWPAGEPVQLIALCDGYIAKSGKAPDVVENPPDPKSDSFVRPQVFNPSQNERLEVEMVSLGRCAVKAVDEGESPVAGVTVTFWPNVCWWNSGSQIYCQPLVRCERLLRNREYMEVIDKSFPEPFQGQTDAHGKLTLELPMGKESLDVSSDVYELPTFLGHRYVQLEVTPDATSETVLRLQPRGTEKLGEWDKLAGVVFGCSTREGRRICALPGVQKQMDEFAQKFREAKNRNDPELLSKAYKVVADAFTGVGDVEEAAKWQQKSDEQAEKAAKIRGSAAKKE